MVEAAEAIASLGPAVLVTGGHLPGGPVDVLWVDGRVSRLTGTRIATADSHGTGCVLSAALTARLALGDGIEDAARHAKRYVEDALTAALSLGSGTGPVSPPATA